MMLRPVVLPRLPGVSVWSVKEISRAEDPRLHQLKDSHLNRGFVDLQV